MDIDPHIVNRAVREILDQLVRDRPDFRWESLCTYSDGRGQTIIELNIYRGGGSIRLGHIVYHLESGDILHHHYRHLNGEAPESIVDFLLDVKNLERG